MRTGQQRDERACDFSARAHLARLGGSESPLRGTQAADEYVL